MVVNNAGIIFNIFQCIFLCSLKSVYSTDDGGIVENCVENVLAFGCKGRGEVIVMRGAWLHDPLLRVPADKCHIPQYNVQFKKRSLLPYFNKKCSLRRSCHFNVWADVAGSKQQEEQWQNHVIRIVYQCAKEDQFLSECSSTFDTPEGFFKSFAYPKYYLGPGACNHIIKADQGQRIKVDLIDISMRDILRPKESECQDYISISEENYEQTWCGDLDEPVSIMSKGHVLNITMHTSSDVFLKRGFAASYATLGCRNPVIPNNVELVERDAEYAKFRCRSRYIFPDRKKPSVVLYCKKEKFWDQNLVDCEDIDALYQNGTLTTAEYLFFNGSTDMSFADKLKHNVAYDIIIPGVIMMFLILGNIVIILLIFLYRSKVSSKEEDTDEVDCIKIVDPIDVGVRLPSQV